MIEVSHLTKRYGSHIAVSDLSFTIEKGRIYGFLGPNGAGKSTTMNIITGCLGPTEGTVLVDGHSVSEEPLLARKCIGYLPEQPPLYMDMTPLEYLKFVASIKTAGSAKGHAIREQIADVMTKTGMESVKNRLIRNLSKGYRQRVGIAQALLGNPEVIILDEPTVGLDPAQIIEIRDLIRSLGTEHTIILSSHILSEVQSVCDSIMILSHGKLVASDTPENLTRSLSGSAIVHLEVKGPRETVEHLLSAVDHIEDTACSEGVDGTVCADISPCEGCDIREDVFRVFAAHDVPILEMHASRPSLEEIFLELTQSESPQPASDDLITGGTGKTDKTNDKEGTQA